MNPREETIPNGSRYYPAWDGRDPRRRREGEIDVLGLYARTLLRWPKTIAIAVLLVAGVTAVASKFYLTRWYKAGAIIRPVSQSALQEQLTGLGTAFGSGGAGISGILGSVSGGAGGSGDAQEFVGILNSFTFLRAVILKHNLMTDLLPDERPSLREFKSSRHLQWLAYRRITSRLTVEYEIKTGNISLALEGTDPARAEVVMGYVIDDFRELLRRKQIEDVRAAIASLNQQAALTSDVTLQSALYQLIADQIQREKIAEVQSDFAFTIIEAPSASDIKVWPPTLLLCLLAGLLTFCAAAACILWAGSEPPGESAGPRRRRHPEPGVEPDRTGLNARPPAEVS